MKNPLITASLVTYHNAKEDIEKVIDSFLGYGETSILFIIDNSADDSLKKLTKNPRIKYVFNNANLGFGAAHNIAFDMAHNLNSTYHISLNPDVYFKSSIIEKLILKLEADHSIGLIMPKVLYPDGETQYLCKLLPTPKDLILRRFIPIKSVQKKLVNRYEVRFFSYNEEAEIPNLSGCFMMTRTAVLRKVGGFDERYFMYLEDIDLCRKIGEISKLLYYPEVEITHNYGKGSYTNKKLLMYHIKSAIRYFNKWGWIFDQKRKEINSKTLKQLKT